MPRKKELTPREMVLAELTRIREIERKLDQTDFLKDFLPKAKALVGTACVYRRNCYSCPEKPSDYFDVFRKVLDCLIDMDSCGVHFICEEIQIDSHGSASLKLVDEWAYRKDPFGTGWGKCSLGEYNSQRIKVVREISQPNRMRRYVREQIAK